MMIRFLRLFFANLYRQPLSYPVQWVIASRLPLYLLLVIWIIVLLPAFYDVWGARRPQAIERVRSALKLWAGMMVRLEPQQAEKLLSICLLSTRVTAQASQKSPPLII